MSKFTNQISLGRATAVKTFTRNNNPVSRHATAGKQERESNHLALLRSCIPTRLISFPAFLLSLIATLAFTATPALAENLTHPLLSTCPGAGKGVAVDEATHEVFVANRSDVERFSFSGGTCSLVETLDGTAAGGFHAAEDVAFDAKLNRLFVADGESANGVVDVFEVGAGEHFLFAIAGGGVPLGRFGFNPLGVAVDEATGVVYVSNPGVGGDGMIDEFSASASGEEYLGGVSTEAYGIRPGRLAVNAAGDVFVKLSNESHLSEVVEFDKAGSYVRTLGGPGAEAVAVDPDGGDVFVAYGKFVEEFASEGISEGVLVSRFGGPNLDGVGGVAVDGSTGDVFVTAGQALDVFGPSAPAPSVTTGVASEVLQTSAELSGVVNPETENPLLPASYQFEYATEAEYTAACDTSFEPEVEWETDCAKFTHKFPISSPVVVGTGTTGKPVSLKVTGLLPSTRYRWRIVGFNPNADGVKGEVEGATGSFYTAGAPKVTEEQASEVGFTSMKFDAEVDPGGLETTYYLQYGASEAYGSKTAEVKFGANEHGSFPVSVEVTGLQPGVVYHARLVASNSASEPPEGSGPVPSGDVEFTTFPLVSGLPDGRVFELVSPLRTHNADIYSPDMAVSDYYMGAEVPFQAAASGDAVTYAGSTAPGGNGAVGGGVLANQYFATRLAGGGWRQSDIAPSGHKNAYYEGFSPELTTAFLQTDWQGGEAPLVSEAPAGYKVLYARDDLTGAKRSLFTGFVGSPPALGTLRDRFAGVSEASGAVLFEASAALVAGAPSAAGVNDLYESVDGSLRLVNVLPEGRAEPEASFGAPNDGPNSTGNPDYSNDISRDGSRVFWTGLKSHGLYLSEAGARTVQLDVANKGLTGRGHGQFWTATPGGSRVFFTDEQKLTSESSAEEGKPDLYEYDVERPVGERLVDLTVAPAGQHANVEGVIGASEDGSYVYFAAGGVLAGNESSARGEMATLQPCDVVETGAHESAYGACNVYVRHEGVTTFIATLSGNDGRQAPYEGSLSSSSESGDWVQGVGYRTAEVTPDGHSLVFMSGEKVSSEEVLLYDAPSGGLTCVSCDPSGQRQGGSDAMLPLSFSLTSPPQWVGDDGSEVFFDSAAALVPQATNGFVNVYEWQRDGTGGCAIATGCTYLLSGGKSNDNSYLLAVTPSGSDVFFITRARLVNEEMDETFKVYDARVDGVQPLAPSVCEGTGCQGLPAPPPIFATPSSITFEGLGNFTTEPPPPPKKVVKKAVKCKKGQTKNKKGKCVSKKKKKTKAKKSAHTDRRTKS